MDYTIQQGDTLNQIAQRFGVDVNSIAVTNGIKDPNKIYAGIKIKIPMNFDKANSLVSLPSSLMAPTSIESTQAMISGLTPGGSTKAPAPSGKTPGTPIPIQSPYQESSMMSGATTGVNPTQNGTNTSGVNMTVGGVPVQPKTTTSSFSDLVDKMRSKILDNNKLVDQRTVLLNSLYNRPPTQAELESLDPATRAMVESGSRQNIESSIRLINDQIAGRTVSLDKSVNYLTDAYQKSVEAAEKEKETALTTLKHAMSIYGSGVGQLYSPEQKTAIKAQWGIDLDNVPAAIGEQRIDAQYGNNGSLGYIIQIPGDTIASKTNNPLNIKYSEYISSLGGKNSGIAGKDGGVFASFNTPEEGLKAALELLQQPSYADLTVDQAMKRWSNNGYGAEVSQFDKNQRMSSLSSGQLEQLVTDMAKRESGASISANQSDIKEIASAVENGTQPPDLKSLYGKSAQVKAQLARDGFNLSKALLQWQAATKWATALNSSQMARFRTLGVAVVSTIDEVVRLADELKLSGIPKANHVALQAWLNLNGNSPHAQTVSQYLAAANTLKEEFANLAQGGYAPTEASWKLANAQINEYYGSEQLKSSLIEVQRLINYRLAAPEQTSPTTPGGGENEYYTDAKATGHVENDPLGIR